MSEFNSLAARAAQKKIDACEEQFEAWQVDHEQAMFVFRCQTLVSDLVEIHEAVVNLSKRYAETILKSPNAYSSEFDKSLKDLYRSWIATAGRVDFEFVNWCIQQGHTVDNHEKLRSCLADAKIAEQYDFDEDSLKRISSVSLSMEELSRIATPLSQWPE